MSISDHAFADGFVFQRVTSEDDARALIEASGAAADPQVVRHLVALWSRFDAGAEVAREVRLSAQARLVNFGDPGCVRIDGPSAIRGILRAEAGGKIRIGRYAYIGDGAIVSARAAVDIGEATLLAHGVQIFDNDSHPTDPFQREIQFRRMLGDKSVVAALDIGAAPVRIGNRCWIGMNSIVLKGVKIGDETIVAASSVVTTDLPPRVLAAGNPARVVKELSHT
ncbi:acyltransferase [Hyphomonas sp.]|uniref:acyltransferase n=1 Tax=Hyphomonas sp. TaxID=87 RepID=UPI001BCB3A4C|nr:acyltransferase [Hyphomonas sp.]